MTLNARLVSVCLCSILFGYLSKSFYEDENHRGWMKKFVALWEDKTANVSMIVILFTMMFLMISITIEKVFVDIKEMERMNLIENTKNKFFEMALYSGVLFLNYREDSFGGLSMLLLVMVFCNLHWLSSERCKEHLNLSNFDSQFLKLFIFKSIFFFIVYVIFQIFVNAERIIFKVLWFEVDCHEKDKLHHDKAAEEPDNERLLLLLPIDSKDWF